MEDKMVFQKTIGENLKKYRKQKGYTQSELAEKAGMSMTFYANLERGAYMEALMLKIALNKGQDRVTINGEEID